MTLKQANYRLRVVASPMVFSLAWARDIKPKAARPPSGQRLSRNHLRSLLRQIHGRR